MSTVGREALALALAQRPAAPPSLTARSINAQEPQTGKRFSKDRSSLDSVQYINKLYKRSSFDRTRGALAVPERVRNQDLERGNPADAQPRRRLVGLRVFLRVSLLGYDCGHEVEAVDLMRLDSLRDSVQYSHKYIDTRENERTSKKTNSHVTTRSASSDGASACSLCLNQLTLDNFAVLNLNALHKKRRVLVLCARFAARAGPARGAPPALCLDRMLKIDLATCMRVQN
ncbi:hypothetical protein EVAR_85645_1 [Eumeta japonica]|uniref:Uncharacterized protein n=1 Tax=Eumeta variegata TaxID=151549 RepID=A0A4C1XSN1_EUMVA|nr:hypothetical protein EVAR_85645_1 [Eumeta japonica]